MKKAQPKAGIRPVWSGCAPASFWLATVCNVALWLRWPGCRRATVRRSTGQHRTCAGHRVDDGWIAQPAGRWQTLKPVIMLLRLGGFSARLFHDGLWCCHPDKSMLVNALQTDMRETRDLLNGACWPMRAGPGSAALRAAVASSTSGCKTRLAQAVSSWSHCGIVPCWSWCWLAQQCASR
jgi:hypothetical protein